MNIENKNSETEIKTKICETCKEDKNIFKFRRNHKIPDGYANFCEECLREKRTKKNSMDAFIRWQGGKRQRNETPSISSSAGYRVYFNIAACEKLMLNKFSGAVIFYDPETKRLGIQFTNNEKEEGYLKVTLRKKKASQISLKSFMDHYKIKPFKQIPLEKTETENFYIARLK